MVGDDGQLSKKVIKADWICKRKMSWTGRKSPSVKSLLVMRDRTPSTGLRLLSHRTPTGLRLLSRDFGDGICEGGLPEPLFIMAVGLVLRSRDVIVNDLRHIACSIIYRQCVGSVIANNVHFTLRVESGRQLSPVAENESFRAGFLVAMNY